MFGKIPFAIGHKMPDQQTRDCDTHNVQPYTRHIILQRSNITDALFAGHIPKYNFRRSPCPVAPEAFSRGLNLPLPGPIASNAIMG